MAEHNAVSTARAITGFREHRICRAFSANRFFLASYLGLASLNLGYDLSALRAFKVP